MRPIIKTNALPPYAMYEPLGQLEEKDTNSSVWDTKVSANMGLLAPFATQKTKKQVQTCLVLMTFVCPTRQGAKFWRIWNLCAQLGLSKASLQYYDSSLSGSGEVYHLNKHESTFFFFLASVFSEF